MRLHIAALALLLAAPSVARAQTRPVADQKKVASVVFDGRSAIPRSVIADSIVTKASRCRGFVLVPLCAVSHASFFYEEHTLDPEELPRDVLRIRVMYFRKGYREARVEGRVMPSGDDVDVAFDIQEGPLTAVGSIAVSPTRPVLTPAQMGAMGLPGAGAPLDLDMLDSAKIRIRNALWDRGYADAVVLDSTVVDPATHLADLRVLVDTKALTLIDTIRIEGNERVSDHTIQRLLDLRPGQRFRRTDVTAAQRRLFESEIFRQSVVSVPPSGDSAKALRVAVREAPLRSLRLGAGINNVEFAQGEGRFVRYDWFGGARRLDVRAVVGNLFATQLDGVRFFSDVAETSFGGEADPVFLRPTWQAGVELTQPFFLSPRSSLGLGVSAHRRVVPGIVVDKGVALDASVTRRPREGVPISLVYRFERADFEAGDLYFCVNFGVCDPATVAALRTPHRLSPIGLSARIERADDPIAPTRGTLAQLELEHASRLTGSSFQYQRVAGELSHYRRAGRKSVIAGIVRGGWVRPLAGTFTSLGLEVSDVGILHPRKRFLSGGARSIRGYAENQMGPKVLTIPSRSLIAPPTATGTPACTVATVADHTCDPNAAPDSVFRERPLGGNTLVEGSLEYRFPVTSTFLGAVFVDAGLLRGQRINFPPGSRSAVTPGFGVRYRSPIGPVRVDLGFKTRMAAELPVVTELADSTGEARLVQLATLKRYDPLSGASSLRRALGRLQLHLAIGEAF